MNLEKIANDYFVAKKLGEQKNNDRVKIVEEAIEIPPFSACLNNHNKMYFIYGYNWVRYVQRFRPAVPIINLFLPLSNMKDYCNLMTASRVRKLLEKCGVISLDKTWVYTENKANTYNWFLENETKFIEFCKENNCDIKIEKEEREIEIDVGTLINTYSDLPQPDTIKLNSKVKYKKPKGLSKELFEAYLIECVKQNYPLYNSYKNLLYSTPSHVQNKYEFSIKWEGDLAKLSLRWTNSICNLPKHQYDKNGKRVYSRGEYNLANGFDLEGDVCSSVPRLQHFLNFGELKDFSYDFYEKINEREREGEKGTLINTFSYGIRESIKKLTIPALFNKTAKSFANNIIWSINQKRKDAEKEGLDFISKEALEAERLNLQKFWIAVNSVVGPSCDSEIFMHESNVMIMIYSQLVNMGYKCWCCYDCIYAQKEGVSQEDFYELFQELYREAAYCYADELWNLKGE